MDRFALITRYFPRCCSRNSSAVSREETCKSRYAFIVPSTMLRTFYFYTFFLLTPRNKEPPRKVASAISYACFFVAEVEESLLSAWKTSVVDCAYFISTSFDVTRRSHRITANHTLLISFPVDGNFDQVFGKLDKTGLSTEKKNHCSIIAWFDTVNIDISDIIELYSIFFLMNLFM